MSARLLPAWWALWWALLGTWAPAAAAQGTALQPVPELRARVMDLAGALKTEEVAALEAQLLAFERRRGTQIVLLLVPGTAPEDIAEFTQRVGDAWKIGRRDVGDGLLFVVAVQERRMRIAPAQALEGAVPDLAARRILDQVVAPAFRQGDLAGGLRAGLEHLQARIEGEALPLPETQGPVAPDWEAADLGALLLVGVPWVAQGLQRLLGRRWGTLGAGAVAAGVAWWVSGLVWVGVLAGGLGLLVALFAQHLPAARSARRGPWGRDPTGGWGGRPGGRWGGGRSGGGFSSGGGGRFGGGGASGGW